jgi:hypothetical protein
MEPVGGGATMIFMHLLYYSHENDALIMFCLAFAEFCSSRALDFAIFCFFDRKLFSFEES